MRSEMISIVLCVCTLFFCSAVALAQSDQHSPSLTQPVPSNLSERAGPCKCYSGKNGKEQTLDIRLFGVGVVTIEELEARLSAYMNAGAPEPILEGTPDEQKIILECVASRGDSQMRALVDNYLKRLTQSMHGKT